MATQTIGSNTALGEHLLQALARIHELDARMVFPRHQGVADEAERQLQQWITPLLHDREIDVPLLRAAGRWLGANWPTGGRAGLVHGDFKANNILVDGDRVTAVLDWELCHVGDPVEDLAWTLLWTTRWDVVGGLFDRKEFLSAYATASGREVDNDRLAYWELFSWVKLASILRRQGEEADKAGSPMLAQLGRSVAHCEVHVAALMCHVDGLKP
jgi:aminoglycoside phosphotransferase (APT) family kinase protein